MFFLEKMSKSELEHARLIRQGNRLLAKTLRESKRKYRITSSNGQYIIKNGIKRISKHLQFQRVGKVFRTFANARVGTLLVCGVLCLGLFTSNAFASRVKKAFINVGGQGQIAAEFMGNTVADVLSQNGITIKEGDEVYPSLNSRVKNNATISVLASKSVVLAMGDKLESFNTVKSTVGEVLAEKEIVLTGEDQLIGDINASITEGMKIMILKGSKLLETVDSDIPYIETRRSVANLNAGESRIAQQGAKGLRRQVYEVTYLNGIAVDKVLVSNEVLRSPVNKVVEVGGATATLASRSSVREASPSAAKEYARIRVAEYGWSTADYNALVSLWQRESGWNVYASNKRSGAYGIPQALPGKKMASHGADWQTNYKTQINWGLSYIKSRYGTPSKAWQHFCSKGWY